jgi:hypothetical protein
MNAILNRLRSVALLAAVLGATFSAGCSGQTSKAQAPTGDAKVGVTINAMMATQIKRMTLTVTDNGNAPTFTAISTNLTNNDPVNALTWQAFVSGIPAGSNRLFAIQAYDAAVGGNLIYQGNAQATITAGSPASVSIILQGNNDGGFQNNLPQIVALSASASTVTVGTTPPPSPVALYFRATDADAGATMTYVWSSSCPATSSFDAATGAVDATNGNTVNWTPPTTATPSACTLTLVVTDNRAGAVHAALAIQLKTSSTGSANVVAYANSWPMISGLAVDETFTKDAVTGQIVSVDYNLAATATDSDADYVTYSWSVSGCSVTGAGNGFTSALVTTPAATLAYGPGALGSSTVHLMSTDLTNPCVITLHVTDYWAPGKNPNGYASGSAKGGDTVAVIDGSAPMDFAIAPVITFHSSPNPPQNPQSDVAATYTAGTSQAIPLTVNVTDGQPSFAASGAPFTYAWTQAGGALAGEMDASYTTTGTSSVVWTSAATYAPNSFVTVTVTSKQGQNSTYTWNFLPANPCNGTNVGATCDTGLGLCAPNGQCTAAGTCVDAGAVVCNSPNQCQNAGACNPSTGACVYPSKPSGTTCTDGTGCTQNDICDGAGVCNSGAPVVCNTPSQCQVAGTGVCQSLSDTTFQCNYTAVTNGTSCNADNNGCTPNDSCQAGACVAGAAIDCTTTTAPACHTAAGAVCQNTGTAGNNFNSYSCVYPSLPDFTSCSTAGLCITGQSCAAGACTGGANKCPAESCNPSTGVCTPSTVAPQFSRDYTISGPAGVAMDATGATYIAAGIVGGPFNFNGHSVASLGDSDIFLAKADSTGLASWAFNFGDAANFQSATGVAVTNDGTVAVIGGFAGTFNIGTSALNNASVIDFLAGFNASTGAGSWAKQFDDGANGALKAVAANPNDSNATHGNRIAICGLTSGGTPTNLVGAGAVAAAGNDIIVGAFKSDGTKLWAFQLNSSGTFNDECDAVAVDANGDVWAAGSFSGASLNFGGATAALPGPASSSRKFLWVAKFNGATGAAISAAAFNGTLGNATPASLAIDSSGNVVVAGSFTSNVTFGTTTLNSAGGSDAFVAKLSGALAPVWSVRLGGTGVDNATGVGVTSFDDVIVTGSYSRTSSGAAVLTNASTTTNPYVLKLNSATGATEDAKGFADASTATGDALAVNPYGGNQIALVGTVNATLTVPAPAGSVTATNVTDVYVIPAVLQ